MNKLIVLLASLALTAAADVIRDRVQGRSSKFSSTRALPALEHEEVHDEFGQFALRYITAEGTVVSERGRLVPNIEGDDYVLIIEGEVSYIGDDGNVYVTKFTAGLDGTRIEGNHIPVAPVTVNSEAVVSEADELNP